jgi:hypothetical protein
VIEPDDGIVAIGSGAPYATAAAKALLAHTDLGARAIVEASMSVAANLCIFTNDQFTIETVGGNGSREAIGDGELPIGEDLVRSTVDELDDDDDEDDGKRDDDESDLLDDEDDPLRTETAHG